MKKGRYPYPKETYVREFPDLYDDRKLVLGVDYDVKPVFIELENDEFRVFAAHVPIGYEKQL